MFSSLRILAALFLWQALVMTAIAPAGATGANQASVGASADTTAFATNNRGPRQLLGTAQTISALETRPEAHDVVERYGFSWLTDEGTMFMSTILPARDTYNFGPGDRLAAYAQAHGLKLHGHALLDPHSTPGWLATGYANNTITQQEAQTIFDNYVTTVIGHYCGKVASWDIINEPFSDTGTGIYRTNSGAAADQNMFWYEIFGGSSYVDRALTLARQTCPQTKLFLNDYGIEWQHNNENPKAAKIVPELQRLKNLGLLDGIGFEGHFHYTITLAYVKAAMDLYSGLGLQVAFSELDLRMVNATPHPDPNNAGKTADLSTAVLNEQASIYGTLAKFCQDNPRCTRFGVWGIDDESSWINAYFGPDAPLLFHYDASNTLVPKPAFYAVASALGITVAPPYAGPPGQIGNLTAVPNTLTSATIAWTTQNLGNSQVFFSTTPGVSTTCSAANCWGVDPAVTTNHVMTLRNLLPATTYSYVVRTENSLGATTSTESTFTTPGLEIVGIGKTYDGTFAALVAVPSGATQLAWTTDNATYHPIQGVATQNPNILAFAGNSVSPNDTPQTYNLVVRYFVGATPALTNIAPLSYDPAFKPTFTDVDPHANTPDVLAIYALAGRGIVQGANNRFRPNDPIVRAEVAAIAARALGWRNEKGLNSFNDQGVVDDDLWNSVRVLADYDVARGYGDGTFQPLGNVLQAQAISLFTRAMVGKGYWQYQPDNSALFPEVPANSGHRIDLVTFQFYTNALTTIFSGANYASPAQRRFVAQVAWETVKWREAQGVAP